MQQPIADSTIFIDERHRAIALKTRQYPRVRRREIAQHIARQLAIVAIPPTKMSRAFDLFTRFVEGCNVAVSVAFILAVAGWTGIMVMWREVLVEGCAMNVITLVLIYFYLRPHKSAHFPIYLALTFPPFVRARYDDLFEQGVITVGNLTQIEPVGDSHIRLHYSFENLWAQQTMHGQYVTTASKSFQPGQEVAVIYLLNTIHTVL